MCGGRAGSRALPWRAAAGARLAPAAGLEVQRATGKCGWKKSEPPSEAGGIKSLWGPAAVRLLYRVNCSWCCTTRELKGPKPGNKTHLQDKTGPCVFSRRVSSLPPVRGNTGSAPRGPLSLAQRLLSVATSISPPPSPAPVLPLLLNGHELGHRRAATCPASLKGAGLRSVGGCGPCIRSTPAARGSVSSGRCQCGRAMR